MRSRGAGAFSRSTASTGAVNGQGTGLASPSLVAGRSSSSISGSDYFSREGPCCAALSRFFTSVCVSNLNSRHSLSPLVTYLCKWSSLRHGADGGSFLLPFVGVGPGRRVRV